MCATMVPRNHSLPLPAMAEPDQAANRRVTVGFWALALSVLFLDQLTKLAVRHWLPVGTEVPIVSPVLSLTHARNTGAAFGILPDGTTLFLVASFGACLFLAWLGPRFAREHSLLFWALGCQFGGALGNLADRLLFGEVTDFLDFHVWPVFNLADTALTVGAGLLVIYLLFAERLRGAKEESTCDPS